ncbi:alpha-mannosidase 2x-like isoform X1 [Palaemon carinicauda]|uniref:alpha-mannosidase 2x-like isoform X1 n=2 Tax=Palaemon carinicauda TaxID=392227 RepID=UPI0035B5C4A9
MLRKRYRMRLRVSSMVFGGAVSLATLVLLYQVLSLPPDTQPPGDRKEIRSLESRLRRLEDDLETNQRTIHEIKSLVRQLANSNIKARILLDPPDVSVIPNKFARNGVNGPSIVELGDGGPLQKTQSGQVRYNISYASVMQDDCIFSQAAPSPVDIQMEDVYSILKFDNPDGGVWKQGWDITYEESQWTPEKKLRVFVVPHSHNDPGWIKTFEQYYLDQTKHILDHMVEKLEQDQRRKFIWAEISFFSMWWNQQPDKVREGVKRLVDRGQLEIVTGGWVMNDEANTHYFAMLEQMVEGHEWLKLHLGVKPNNGWAIDPFGMTPTMAYLLKRMGLENMLIQRVHYSIKKHFAREKSLEFKWRQIWDTGSSTDMFCHMMPFYSYDVPHTCGPDPKVCCQFDFHRLSGSGVTCPWRIPPQPINDRNVQSRSQQLLDQYRKKAQLYKTNVLLVPLGDDFRYVRSDEWDKQFENYQKLFDYMNARDDLHVEAQFGTLADYFRAVHEESDTPTGDEHGIFPSLSGDFFTYADRDDHYWSGYYTSRPFHKKLDRVLEAYLRGAEIIYSTMLATQSVIGTSATDVTNSLMDHLVSARRHLALFQHHDGITGTAKDHVVVDYAKKMLEALHNCQHVIQQTAHYLLNIEQRSYSGDKGALYYELGEKFIEHNKVASHMVVALRDGSTVPVVIYNPDGHQRRELFTVRTSSPHVEILIGKETPIPFQVDPVFIGSGEASENMFDVTFFVDLPSLSLTTYTIKAVQPGSVNSKYGSFANVIVRDLSISSIPSVFSVVEEKSRDSFTVQNKYLEATFGDNGFLQSLKVQGHKVPVALEFVKYGVKNNRETSGAYLFLPDREAVPVPVGQPGVTLVQGSLMSTVSIQMKNVLHTVKIKNSPGIDGIGIDIANYVDITAERNFEFVMRLSTDIKSDNIFFTDLNGFQIIRRTRYNKLPLQANYYPIPSQAFIQDQEYRLSLLSAQPLGGSSLKSGQLEIMMDRRLNQDDNRGVGQGVLDNLLTPNVFRLLLEPRVSTKESSISHEGSAAYPSLVAHAGLTGILYPLFLLIPTPKIGPMRTSWSIGGSLPCDVHLVNLRTMLSPASENTFANHYEASTTASLTLHRMGFDCGFKSPGLTCSTNGGKVQLMDLFPNVFNEQVHQMSLSMMYEGVDMTKSYPLSLLPMELYTFRLSRS